VIRAFIAVEISPATTARIVTAIDVLKQNMPGISWVAPENFHLTVKFLGSIEASRVGALGDALDAVITPFPRCTINAKGLGVFPGLRQPKVLWVGFIGDELKRLAVQIETALLALGFPPEPRVFSPHLTIGRWRQMRGLAGNIKMELQQWRERDFGKTLVDRVTLFQSDLKPTGAVYSQLRVFKLNEQPID